jgi:hypothetical protein
VPDAVPAHHRGGSVGQLSTRAVSDIFKNNRDELDITSQGARKEPPTHPNTVTDEDDGMVEDDMNAENLDGELEREIEDKVDEEDQLSDSEVVDYRYELESDPDEEEDDDREVGEEDDTSIGELGYGDY